MRWFLDSGTEIGAVRDGDFIPWDDDADTKILAEDYPAFKTAMEKNLPSYMHLVAPWDFAPSFYYLAFRIYDDRYPLREPNDEDDWYHDYLRYAFVDVFAFTKAPSSKLIQKWLIFKEPLKNGQYWGSRGKRRESSGNMAGFREVLSDYISYIAGFSGKRAQ